MKARSSKFYLGLLVMLLFAPPVFAQDSINSLATAMQKVQAYHPEIRALPLKKEVALSNIKQASRSPNPQLELGIENFGGNNDELRQSETSISLSREFELGDKLKSRTKVATSEKLILEQRLRITRDRILANVKRAFARLLHAQAQLKLDQENHQQTTHLVIGVRRKHSAGALLDSQKTLAELELQRIELNIKNTMAELEIARYQLAALWGGDPTDTYQISGTLDKTSYNKYLDGIDLSNSPRLKLAKLNRIAAQHNTALEKSLSTPNVEFGVGYRRIEESDTNTFLATFAVELPLSNSNSDAIASAEHELRASGIQEQATAIELEQQKSILQLRLRNYIRQKTSLTNKLIPLGEKALAQKQLAYQKGRIEFDDVMDSLQTLIESKKNHLNILLEIINTTIDMDELTGSIGEQL